MLKTLVKRVRAARFLADPAVRIEAKTFRLPRFQPFGITIDEPWMLHLLRHLINHKTGAFIDIGVNVGQTLLCAKSVDPHLSYVGLDPNPRCIAYAEEIAELNCFNDVRFVCAGVGDTLGLSVLELYSANPRDSSASVSGRTRPGETVHARKTVTMITFNEVLGMLGTRAPGIIKIDVEGGEAAIFKSLEPHLESLQPWIIFEVLPAYDKSFVDRIKAQELIEALLARASYKLYRIAKSVTGGFSGAQPVDEFGLHRQLTNCDYLAVPLDETPALASIVTSPK